MKAGFLNTFENIIPLFKLTNKRGKQYKAYEHQKNKYYEQFYANNFYNLNKMNQYTERHSMPKLTEKKI